MKRQATIALALAMAGLAFSQPTAMPTTTQPMVSTTMSPSTQSPVAPTTTSFSDRPSSGPSNAPSLIPSVSPSESPSVGSSAAPVTQSPVAVITSSSDDPSSGPSNAPSLIPSVSPSGSPSVGSSAATVTQSPVAVTTSSSDGPSSGPSNAPSLIPSVSPSESPSVGSAPVPAPVTQSPVATTTSSSDAPSILPSSAPSILPSSAPSVSPSESPSVVPGPVTVSDRLVDIGFVVDVSGSFRDDIVLFKSQANGIVSSITNVYPNAHFGLVTFQDFPLRHWGDSRDTPHAQIKDIGAANSDFINAVNSLTARGGGDYRESQLVSLHQSITGSGLEVPATSLHSGYTIPPGLNFHFRSGSSRLIILWTDALFHTPSSTFGYPGPSVADVIAAARSPATRRNLRVNRHQDHRSLIFGPEAIRIVGIQSGSYASVSNSIAEIARGTGAVAGADGVDCDGDGFIDISEGEPIVCLVERGLSSAIVSVVEGIVPEIPEIPTAPTTPQPTQSPVATIPTSVPSALPSESPSAGPTPVPTPAPKPSSFPSAGPSESPSNGPTPAPTQAPSVTPSTSPTSSPTAFPTITRGCGKLRGCFLENLATREQIRLDPTETTSYSISGGEQYSVRCNVEGRLYNMAFVYGGSIKKERRRPYYMNGDTWNGEWPVANNVPYLSEGCGSKEFIARGRIWAGACFSRTFKLEALCDE